MNIANVHSPPSGPLCFSCEGTQNLVGCGDPTLGAWDVIGENFDVVGCGGR